MRIIMMLVFLIANAAPAFAQDYRCQIVSLPELDYQDVTWDGLAPADFTFDFNGQEGQISVDEIGLAGHPEYLFSFRVGSTTVLAVSQKKALPDYNLTWRSATFAEDEAFISLACRRPR